MLPPETAPDALAGLFGRHRAVHPYGLADLEEPFWQRSRWYRRGDAAVGVLDLPDVALGPTGVNPRGGNVVYAVSAVAPGATLDLLRDLAPMLPAHFLVTGPCGLAACIPAPYMTVWSKPHWKMWLPNPSRLPPAAGDVETLDRGSFPDLVALYATDADAGDFFTDAMLDTGCYVGRRVGGELIAAAGVHVVSDRRRVGAIGNVATHPDHRRRGHAAAVVATLCHRLVERVDTVGLNVAESNTGARRVYARLGFEVVLRYDEAELRRR